MVSSQHRMPTLAEIAGAVVDNATVELHGADVPITDVFLDSRAVSPGSLYVAIRGAKVDGHSFIDAAIARGAAAVMVEEPPSADIPYLLTANTRHALGWVAAAVHGWPARDLHLVGITGTNGKTTVAHMLAAMAAANDRVMAVVGTVSANLDDVEASPRTTPESSDLQRVLRQLVDRGRIADVAVEVSSHAMEMGRVNGTRFDVVAFTNLSQDHLDYHHTMEDYFAAKAKLFTNRWSSQAVIWTDDPWGLRLSQQISLPAVRVGTDRSCDVVVSYGEETPNKTDFTITLADRAFDVAIGLAGRFNVANAAIALTCARLQQWDIDACVAALATMPPVPGRYNTIPNNRDIWVVVDYAHTPDAILSVITETRELVAGRVIALVGAGGDRDREKRPLMGHALAAADIAIATTDNPRSEDPDTILEQLLSGLPPSANVFVEPDRRRAISLAINQAEPGDAVLILGKGHETDQEFADHTIPFNDATVAEEELKRLDGATF